MQAVHDGSGSSEVSALAQRYPGDPAAVDALVWIIEKTMRYMDSYHPLMAETIDRSMELLTRDHLGDARLGPLCLKLVRYPSSRRDVFLRVVAERSPDRVVRGRAMLVLAQYLKMKGEFAGSLKKSPKDGDYEETLVREMYGPEYLKQLRAADPAPMLREADELFARVLNDYGEIAFTPPCAQPTRETLAVVATRELAEIRTISVGRPAPEITGEDVNGKPMKLSEFR